MLWNAKNGSVPLGTTEMSYVSFGTGEKNLILLPGLSDGLATVKGKALLLAPPYRRFFKEYTVYMFSRKNEMPQGYSIRDMAEDQASALKVLGIERCSVLGVSQGGMIAQYLAIDHADLIDRLVLAVTAPCVNETSRSSLTVWMKYAGHGDHKSLMIDTAEKSYSEAYLRKFRILYPIIGKIGKPSDYRRFMINAEAILNFNAEDDLERIKCPVLIIGGAKDLTVGPQAAYDLHARIRNSELYIYPEYGHAVYEEADDFNERVLEFLERAEV